MEKLLLEPREIAKTCIEAGMKKSNLESGKMLILGILAGMFVGLGAHGSIVAMQSLGENVDVGLAKFLGASIFPAGIILVILAGAELFTGNCLISISVMAERAALGKMLKNWTVVYFGNFAGSILLVWLMLGSGLYASEAVSAKAIGIAEGKAALTFGEAVIRGVLCNMLVVLAVWMQAGAKTAAGKIAALWFPVMLFVLSGFEHSIANMYFLPLAKLLGLDISWASIWMGNLLPVTIGNIIGGAVVVPLSYWLAYGKEKRGGDFDAERAGKQAIEIC